MARPRFSLIDLLGGKRKRQGVGRACPPKRRSLQMEHLERRELLTIDLATTGFDADGDQLRISYDVVDQAANAFDVGVYRSSDGVTLDSFLDSYEVSQTEDLGVGSHTVTFTPTVADVAQDYKLIAVLDINDENTEADEDNNDALFAGGVFQADDGVVHVHGTDGDNWVRVYADDTDVAVTNGPYRYEYGLASVEGVHFRGHAGNDYLWVDPDFDDEPVWAFGGAGTDTLPVETNADGRLETGPGFDWPEVSDDTSSGEFTATGGWSESSDAGALQGRVHTVSAGGGTETATWQFDALPEGDYRVLVRWTSNVNRATNAPYSVYDDTTLLTAVPVRVDQQSAPAETEAEGWSWHSLGTYEITSGTLKVRLSDDANGVVAADLMSISASGEGLPKGSSIYNHRPLNA